MLLTLADLREQDQPDRWVRRAAQRGELIRFAPGVFVGGGTDLAQRAAAATAHAPEAAARSVSSLEQVRAIVMAAVQCGFVTEPELSAGLAAGARNGSGLCRRALRDVRHGAASPPEAELADVALALANRRRIPPFLLNPSVLRHGVLVGIPDGWFPDLGFGWEVDSREFHSEEADFDRTLARHDEFARHGLALLHVTPRRLRQLGMAYGQVLLDAVTARRASGYTALRGLSVLPKGPFLP